MEANRKPSYAHVDPSSGSTEVDLGRYLASQESDNLFTALEEFENQVLKQEKVEECK